MSGRGTGTLDQRIDFSVEGRYPHQVWEIEVPLARSRFRGRRPTFARLVEDLHDLTRRCSRSLDRRSHIEALTWRAPRHLPASARPFRPPGGSAAGAPGKRAASRLLRRQGSGPHGGTALRRGCAGESASPDPPIVESGFTTIVVEPERGGGCAPVRAVSSSTCGRRTPAAAPPRADPGGTPSQHRPSEAAPQTDETGVEANGALAKPWAVMLLAASNLQSTKPRCKTWLECKDRCRPRRLGRTFMNSEDGAAVERGYDGVRLAVLGKRFESVASRMANTLLRTGRSGVLNMARDFSCCIVTADLRAHLRRGVLPDPRPARSGSHGAGDEGVPPRAEAGRRLPAQLALPRQLARCDHVILVPVIDDDGVHRFTVLAKAHQADCGNSLPTTYMGAARDVYQEGALIFPAVQVQRDYRDIEDIIRMCRMRIRVPISGTATISRCSARHASASGPCSRWAGRSAGSRSPSTPPRCSTTPST